MNTIAFCLREESIRNPGEGHIYWKELHAISLQLTILVTSRWKVVGFVEYVGY